VGKDGIGVGPLFCVLRDADQKNGTVSGFLPKMIHAYNENKW
jgi:hypothetical protein